MIGTKDEMGKGHSLLPFPLLEERCGLAMATLLHLPEGGWKRQWLPSLLYLEKYEDVHHHDSPLLIRREAEFVAFFFFPSRRGIGGSHDHSLPLLMTRRTNTPSF